MRSSRQPPKHLRHFPRDHGDYFYYNFLNNVNIVIVIDIDVDDLNLFFYLDYHNSYLRSPDGRQLAEEELVG